MNEIRNNSWCQRVACLLLFGAAMMPRASFAQSNKELDDDVDRAFLRDEKLPTDGPALLQLLDKFSGHDADLLQIDDLVKDLGHANFARRAQASQRLVALGQAALAKLQLAQESKDAETVSRAGKCIKDISDKIRLGVPLVTVRYLCRVRPDGLAEALLRFLPYTAEEEVEEEIYFGLYGLVKDRPNLLATVEKALKDPLSARRALAACIVGRLGDKAQQVAVRPLLDDPTAAVRLRAAQGLLAGKSAAGVPTLIQLLEEPSVHISWSAEELLHWLAGDNAPAEKVGAASDKERQSSRKAWEGWWRKKQEKIDFAEVDKDNRRPGMYMIIGETQWKGPGDHDYQDQMWMCGCDGTVRWRIKIDLINEVRVLSNNHLLVGGHDGVSERDLHGKILWRPEIILFVPPPPELGADAAPVQMKVEGITSCRRLPNGNTLLALANGAVVIINRAGSPLWHKPPAKEGTGVPRFLDNGRPRPPATALMKYAIFLRNGNTVACGSNFIGGLLWELDSMGKVLWEIVIPNSRPDHFQPCLALVRLGFDAPRPAGLDLLVSLPHRLQQLKNRDLLVRTYALQELGKLGEKAAPAIPALIKEWDESSPGFTFMTMSILGNIGPQAFPVVFSAAKDKRFAVRASALIILGAFTDKTQDCMPVWIEALKDQDVSIRRCALQGLAGNLERRLMRKLPVEESEKQQTIRRVASFIWDPDDQLFGPTDAQARIGDGMGMPILACWWLRQFGREARVAIPDLIKFIIDDRQKQEVRAFAVHVLGQMGSDASPVIPTLVEVFSAKASTDMLRVNVIMALEQIGPKAKPATPLLVNILQNKSLSLDYRARAIFALAKIGHRTIAVEQALTAACADERLRADASKALEALRRQPLSH